MNPVSSILTPWSSFFVMTGSSAAALTGLMFIVVTLISGSERLRAQHSTQTVDSTSVFSTPTVVHFAVALLVSALLTAPWRTLFTPALVLGFVAICCLANVVRATVRLRRMDNYTADGEDWTWYGVLPAIAYLALLVGAVLLTASGVNAMFWCAGCVVLLMGIGVHNAWDIVTYIALRMD